MKLINRAIVRGKPLDKDCRTANRVSNLYGDNDNRIFCYGLYEDMNDWEIKKKCWECKAFEMNAEPLIELGGKA